MRIGLNRPGESEDSGNSRGRRSRPRRRRQRRGRILYASSALGVKYRFCRRVYGAGLVEAGRSFVFLRCCRDRGGGIVTLKPCPRRSFPPARLWPGAGCGSMCCAKRISTRCTRYSLTRRCMRTATSCIAARRPWLMPVTWLVRCSSRGKVKPMATAGRTAYAIRLAADGGLGTAGTLVGTSCLSEADLRNESIHLGSTLYGSRWWGTQVNPESKLLLLAHCFEDCGYGRVKIQTDALNTRSQAAIAKLGAVREGVLRRHLKREDGTFRDSVVYSVLTDEWPNVKARLIDRLG